jgi:hypothetical protein
MKILSSKCSKYKIFILSIAVFACSQVFFVSTAKAQIDFYYGKNPKGLRIGGGVGFTTLFTHYSSYPIGLSFVGDLDYAFNPYFSIGINSQYGKLQGTDNTGKFYYQTSTDSYMSASFNIKAGLGLITDFNARNGFQDALKRLYMGFGVGAIKTSNVITTNPNVSITTVYADPENKNGEKLKGTLPTLSMYVGTYIDLPGVWGTDKLEICPNYQLNYVNDYYLDGYKSKEGSTLKGFYIINSISIRYKF